jgi:hypothetical protein
MLEPTLSAESQNGKPSSLLQEGINYERKKFYGTDRRWMKNDETNWLKKAIIKKIDDKKFTFFHLLKIPFFCKKKERKKTLFAISKYLFQPWTNKKKTEKRFKMENHHINKMATMEQCALKNVNNYLNTNIYSYLEGSWLSKFYSIFKCSSSFQHQC